MGGVDVSAMTTPVATATEDISGVPEEIPIRLVAGVSDPALRGADGAELSVPSRMGRKALRDLVHHLLGCTEDGPDLHFLVEGSSSLRTTLAKFIHRRKLSAETRLVLTYFIPLPPPERSGSLHAANDWLADISVLQPGGESGEPLLLAAAYSGLPVVATPDDVIIREDDVRSDGHSAPLKGVAWLADGSSFVTAGHDGVAKVWSFERNHTGDKSSACCCGVFRSEDVTGVTPFESTAATSVNGKAVIALGASNGSIWVLEDVAEALEKDDSGDRGKRKQADVVDIVGRHVGTTSPDLAVSSLRWRGTGSDVSLVSAGLDGMVRAWDVDAGTVSLTVPGGGKALLSLAVSDTSVLVAAADGAVRVLDGRDGRGVVGVTGRGKAHVGMATGVTWMVDGASFASGGLDGSVRAWDMRSYDAPVHVVEEVHGERARSLSLASVSQSDRTSVYSAGEDGIMRGVSFQMV